MKKTLLLSLFLLGLTVFSLPAALIAVNAERERILIGEEVLSGDPAEAAGITLKIPSHIEKMLLWKTRYVIGSEREAESNFSFSSRPVSWRAPEETVSAYLHTEIDALFWATYGEDAAVTDWDTAFHSKMFNDVAGRTEKGSRHTETILIGDYGPNYPLAFDITGRSVLYEGDYAKACYYLTDFFHVPAAGDKAEVTVERDEQGNIVATGVRLIGSDETVSIAGVAADDEAGGLYYTYCLRNAQTDEWTDRGQNMGIFYFPYQEQDSRWSVDLTQVRKLCDHPGRAVPLQMLADGERGILYLAVREGEDYGLLVYRLEDKVPILAQQVPVQKCRTSNSAEGADGTASTSFCRMSLEDGGILMTWEDNSFAFIAREQGQYRLWCSGMFPKNAEQGPGNPFPREQVCLFNGERLFLAAYESWYGTNVLLSVYDGQVQTYSGRYVHSGQGDLDMGFDSRNGMRPQGIRPESPEPSARMGMDGPLVKPLEMTFCP